MTRLLQGIRAVVFDAVGTLIHPEPSAPEVYARIGRRFGSKLTPADIAPRFSAAFRDEDASDLTLGWQTSEAREHQRWRHIVSRVLDDVSDPESCFQELFVYFGQPLAWRCEPDCARVLQTLADRGYLLAMASNYDSRLRSVAAGLPGLHPLRHLVISSEVGWRKPAGAFFAALLTAVQQSAANVLYVGDDPINDYAGAAEAGLRAVLFDPKGRAAASPATRITRLADLVTGLRP